MKPQRRLLILIRMKKYVNTDITALTVRKKCALVERMAIVLDYLLYYVVEFVVQDFFVQKEAYMKWNVAEMNFSVQKVLAVENACF